MSVNKYLPHLLVLPEDDANRQMANGFVVEVATRQIQALTEAGGWHHVCGVFESDHISDMRRFKERSVVLLVDFDADQDRFDAVLRSVPADLTERVFVLGAWTEPEELKAVFGSYEEIGGMLAKDCRTGSRSLWSHELLRHNEEQLNRLCRTMVDVLK